MPHYLARLPRDKNGYPITYTVFFPKPGVPDFTTSDPVKWALAAKYRCCGLCGIVLKEKVWFIGGPVCMKTRYFFDHPMHEECARYALVVCPYISMPRYLSAKMRATPEWMREELVTTNSTKPDKFGLASAMDYAEVVVAGDHLLLAAPPWESLEWWKDGKPLV